MAGIKSTYMETGLTDVFMASLWRQGHAVVALRSLMSQKEFGTAHLTCNNFTDEQWSYINEQLKDERVFIYRHNNEKGSNEKLRYLSRGKNTYVCFADDDLIYPPDYLAKLIAGVEKYHAYCSLHGAILKPGLIQSYYRDRQVFRGLKSVYGDIEVDIASNCGSVFRRDFFPADYLSEWYDHVGTVSMDDIYTNFFCRRFGIKRMVLDHQEGYLKHKVQYPEDDYVFNKHALVPNGDLIQTAFINSFFWKK